MNAASINNFFIIVRLPRLDLAASRGHSTLFQFVQSHVAGRSRATALPTRKSDMRSAGAPGARRRRMPANPAPSGVRRSEVCTRDGCRCEVDRWAFKMHFVTPGVLNWGGEMRAILRS